jgi:hypothetical protein
LRNPIEDGKHKTARGQRSAKQETGAICVLFAGAIRNLIQYLLSRLMIFKENL